MPKKLGFYVRHTYNCSFVDLLELHLTFLLTNSPAYYEVCRYTRNGWNYKWLENEKTPFIFWRKSEISTWVAFDDVRSVNEKALYLKSKGLGGATLFALPYDDFRNHCFEDPFPLLRVINFHLSNKVKVAYPDPELHFNYKKNFKAYSPETRFQNFIDTFDPSSNKSKIFLSFTEQRHFESSTIFHRFYFYNFQRQLFVQYAIAKRE